MFTNERIVEEQIGPYYDNPDYISHTDDQKGLFSKVYQTLRQVNLRRKLSYVADFTTTGRVLDYGCGTGQFLEALQLANHEASGVEINSSAREKAARFGAVSEDISGVGGDLDVITMWHVMEHVYDLHGLVQEFKNRLKKGGALIIAVPNPESPDAAHYGEHWAAWDVPIHAHHFTKKSMQSFLSAHDFKLHDIIPMDMDAYYISLLSEQYKDGASKKSLKHWLNAVNQGFKSNSKAGKENTSSLIYRFILE
ncbi:MAG: class I SAM-dependent methyltransferase [Schleiferiaceae bacterium]